MVLVWVGVGVVSVSLASHLHQAGGRAPLTVAAYRMCIATVIVGVTAAVAGRGDFAAVRRSHLPLLAGSGVFLAATSRSG